MIAAQRGLRIAFVFAALVAPLLAGCNGVLPSDLRETTGIVTSVEGPNAAQVDTFTVRAPDGVETRFTVGELRLDRESFPAVHLPEHRVTLQPVRVQYVERDGQNVALRLSDAPAP